jgi:hypothetical protein
MASCDNRGKLLAIIAPAPMSFRGDGKRFEISGARDAPWDPCGIFGEFRDRDHRQFLPDQPRSNGLSSTNTSSRVALRCNSSVDTVNYVTMHSQPGRHRGWNKIVRLPRKPGTGHSLQNETEIQLPDQEIPADDLESVFLLARDELALMVRTAAHQAWAAIDRAGGASTGQLAELAYAFACLEGARRGVLPGTPPPQKNSAPAATPPSRPTSSPQPGPSYQSFGDTTRTNR